MARLSKLGYAVVPDPKLCAAWLELMRGQAVFERHPDRCKQASCLLPTYVARKQLLPKLAAADEPSAITEGPTRKDGVSTHLTH